MSPGGEHTPKHVRSTAATPPFRYFVAGVWRTDCYERLKPSTRRAANYALASQLLPVFGDMPLDRIGRRVVHLWFDRYSATAPGGANRTLGLLQQIMSHAKVRGHFENNPASGIRRNPRQQLTRFLSRDEIIRLHKELDRLCCGKEVPCRSGGHHTPAVLHRMPTRRDPESEMAGSRRRYARPG